MNKISKQFSVIAIAILLASVPFMTMAQEISKEATTETNKAPSYNYWSVGVFGGVMQFNGDLSKNHWINLYPLSVGYNVGVVAAKQFTRVIGVRAQ